MSQENVERIKEGFAAHNRGDLDAMVELYDRECVFETLLLGTHHGNDAIRLLYEENKKTLSGYHVVPVELIDVGDKVVAVVQMEGTGPVSQIALDDRFAFVFTLRDGRIVREQAFRNREEALEAAGLREEAMSQENVEIVKRFIPPPGSDYTELFGNDAAWAALKESLEPVVTPDFEGAFVALGQRMQFTGLEGMRQGILEWVTPWTSYYDEIEDVFGVRDDRVVVLGRQHGYRLDTDAEVVAESAGVYLLRNGKIARVDLYVDRAEALEAVGLSEQAKS